MSEADNTGRGRHPRLQPPAPEQMNEHQRRVHQAIVSGPRGQVRGPLAIWLHRPGLAEQAQALGRYCRYDSSLPPRLSELAILTVAACWRAEFEWWAHEPIALQAGISKEAVGALAAGDVPPLRQADERMVYEFVHTLIEQRSVPQPLYESALQTLGRDAVVDLVGLAGYYTLVSMTLNVFEVEPQVADRVPVFGGAAQA
ncbi:carboxymuconolactone decarboxylase family protein [Candidimonas nitroreducens]|nr:carboxymuconolactone decarboxylase family protein [Candidimonas nitroreducens]